MWRWGGASIRSVYSLLRVNNRLKRRKYGALSFRSRSGHLLAYCKSLFPTYNSPSHKVRACMAGFVLFSKVIHLLHTAVAGRNIKEPYLAKVTQAYFFIYLWINHAYHQRFTPNCLFGARKNPFMIYTFFPCKCNWKSVDFCDIYNFPNDCISLGIWFLGVIYLLQKEQKTSKLYFRFS